MRTWMRFVAAVLLILPTTALLRAADPEITIKKEDYQKLLDKLDKLQSDMTANSLKGSRTAEDLRGIREELQRIRELLEHMAQKQGAIQRQSAYGPSSPPPGAAIPTTATITLQNNYLAAATVRINGRPYVVEPGQPLNVGVPIGMFQYSVDVDGFGTVGPLRTDTLRPVGYRITIFPNMP